MAVKSAKVLCGDLSKDLPPVESSESSPGGPAESLPSILIQTGSEKSPTLMYVLPQGQKPYQCGFCDLCFDVVRDLYNHVNVHLSANPYKCGYCKASYKTNFSLTVHVKTHKLFLCLPQSQNRDNLSQPNEEMDLPNDLVGNSSVQNYLDLQSIKSISSVRSFMEKSVGEGCDLRDDADSAMKQTAQNQKYVLLVDKGELFPSKSKVLGRSVNTGELTLEDRPIPASAMSQSSERGQCEESTGSPTRDSEVPNAQEMSVEYENDSDNDDENEPLSPGSHKSLETSASVNSVTTDRMLVHIDSLLARNSEIIQMISSPPEFKNTPVQKRGRGKSNKKPTPKKKKKSKKKKSALPQAEDQPAQHTTYEQYGALKPFACALCGDKFADPKLISEHFRGVHKLGKDQILLPHSNKDQADSDQEAGVYGKTDSHASASASESSKSNCFLCPVCERPFKFCQDLIQHIELGHENDLRPFECGMCRRRFKQTAHLRDHFDAFHGSGLTRAKRLKLSKSSDNAVHDLNHQAGLYFHPDGTRSESKDSSDVVCKTETDSAYALDTPEIGQGGNTFLSNPTDYGYNPTALAPNTFTAATDEVAGVEASLTFPDPAHLWPTETGEDKPDVRQCLQHAVPEPNTLARPFLCSFCKEDFEDVKLIRLHVQSVHKHDKNQAAAANPDQNIFSEKELASPEGDYCSQKDGGSFSKLLRCYICEKPFKLHQDLGRHVLADHGEKELRIFECSLCGRMFKRGHYIRIHFKLCHDDSFSSHQCHQCGKKFPVLYQLTRHEKTCSSIRDSQKTPRDPGGLVVKRDHDKASKDLDKASKSHKSGKRRADICYICGTITHQLQQHIKIHQSVGSYQCRFCSKIFRHRSVLHKHLNLHTHEKTYVCDTCGKSFATLYSWKIHRNTHTNERPYKCELCGRGFNAMSHLGVHKMRHYQDKRYQCDKCDRKFYTKTNLKKHALTHTDLRPFCCKECGKTYRCWGSLKYHKDHKHPATG